MFRHRRFLSGFAGIIVLLVSLVAGSTTRVSADSRSLHWDSWTVDISKIETTNNVFHVSETQQIAIETGPFNGADRRIPLGRVTRIDNIAVFDNETKLQTYNATPANCSTLL